jgi:hypothetical protein
MSSNLKIFTTEENKTEKNIVLRVSVCNIIQLKTMKTAVDCWQGEGCIQNKETGERGRGKRGERERERETNP